MLAPLRAALLARFVLRPRSYALPVIPRKRASFPRTNVHSSSVFALALSPVIPAKTDVFSTDACPLSHGTLFVSFRPSSPRRQTSFPWTSVHAHRLCSSTFARHSREGGNPATLLSFLSGRQRKRPWVPAFAGMTSNSIVPSSFAAVDACLPPPRSSPKVRVSTRNRRAVSELRLE